MTSSTTPAACPVSDQEKQQVWAAYHRGQPIRVPVTLGTNPRVVLCNPQWNPQGITFEQYFHDPQTHVQVNLLHQLYRRTVLHRYCDHSTQLPDCWRIGQDVFNVYEAAAFGAPIRFPEGQVPCTEPILDDANRETVFDQDVEHPLDHGFLRQRMDFWHEMQRVVEGMTFEGRPVTLAPWAPAGSDGPVTVACNLRGTEFLMDLAADPEYAQRLMRLIVDAALHRRRALVAYWGDRIAPPGAWFADDSVAMLSLAMYREQILPLHRLLYESGGDDRHIHLCGDATHLFGLLHRELGITHFETGFPVDFAALRHELGTDVEIIGGPQVDLLLRGEPGAVYERSREILASGVCTGGRFTLREGNNLPPNVPEENLAAMYQAALDHGG